MTLATLSRRFIGMLAIAATIALAGCASAAPIVTLAPVDAAANNQLVAAATQVVADPATASPDGAAASATCAKLNLNDLTEDQLMTTIPNFNPRMVREFLEYRPYVSIQQFRREIGKYVDANQVADYEKYVYAPVSANDSDAASLMQLPGVDAAIADKLISARPYASPQAFMDALAGYVSPDQAAQASCFLSQ